MDKFKAFILYVVHVQPFFGILMIKNPDICVVGSGAAGSFLAKSLFGSGLSILILETGGEHSENNIKRYIQNLDIPSINGMNYGFSRQLGGSTNLWAGRVAPFESSDYSLKPSIQSDGWPIEINDLIPFYDKASEIMGLPPYEYFVTNRVNAKHKNVQHLVDMCKRTHLHIKKFVWSSPPFNSRLKLLPDLAEDISIQSSCHVTQIFESKSRDQIDGLEYINNKGETVRIHPKQVVLAAGGVENVRILLNSVSVDANGVGNSHDVVGRYFSTHPKADMGVLLLNKSVPINDPLFVDCDKDGMSARQGIGFTQEKQISDEMLNHYVQLTPMLEYTASTLFENVKNSSALNANLINKNKVLSGFLPGLGHIVFEIIGRIAKLQTKSKKFILRTFLDQHPDKDNRITLSDELDEYGYRKVDIHWRYTDRDRLSVLNFFDDLNNELKSKNIGHIEYSKLQELEEWPMTAIHSHFMGATRMGDNPKTSVVDKNCKVHGYNNLFVAGPSVFPTYGYANPVYTIAALSLRLGEFLKDYCRQNV